MKERLGASTVSVRPDARRVRELRRARGWSLSALAVESAKRQRVDQDDLVLSVPTIKRIESGKSVWPSSLRALAKLFDVAYLSLVLPDPPDSPPRNIGGEPRVGPPSAEDPGLGSGVGPVLRTTHGCRVRFDSIIQDDRERVAAGSLSPEGYWQTFWSLQQEQFRQWRAGSLDRREFLTWMNARRREYRYNHEVGCMAFRAGWEKFRGRTEDAEFVEFMEGVFRGLAVDLLVVPAGTSRSDPSGETR